MDDNVKTVPENNAAEQPKKNYNNRNRSRNRNRNYKKNYHNQNQPSENLADNAQASKDENANQSKAARSNNSGKPRGQYNRNSDNTKSAGGERRSNNRNQKNRSRTHNESKPKSYYMSKPLDEEEFDSAFGDVFQNEQEPVDTQEAISNFEKHDRQKQSRDNTQRAAADETEENPTQPNRKPKPKKAAADEIEENPTQPNRKPKPKKAAADEIEENPTQPNRKLKPKKAAADETEENPTQPNRKPKPKKAAADETEENPTQPNRKPKPKKAAADEIEENPTQPNRKPKPKKAAADEIEENPTQPNRKPKPKKTAAKDNSEKKSVQETENVPQAKKRRKESSELRRAAHEVSSSSKEKASIRRSAENEADILENRKKSDTRFWTRFASLAAIVPVYTAIVVCMIAMPRSTVSNLEKRNLDQFPEFSWTDYWSGTYTASIAHYFDDTVPYRDTLKQAGSQLLNFLGIKYNDVQINGQMEVVNNTDKVNDSKNNSAKTESQSPAKAKTKSNTSSKSEDTDSEEDVTAPKGQEIADGVYVNGVIVVHQDGHYRAMSMYGGGSGEVYASAVNGFAEDLPGVRVYSMVDPTSSEFYTPLNFSDYNASQSDDIDSINSMLQNVTGINVCSTLSKHVNETIYTRTDHHWMSLGAYYAAQDFAKAAGVPFMELKNYEKKKVPGYVGTFYAFSGGNANLLNDPEDFIYYVPKNKNYKVEYYDYAYNFQFEGDMFVEVADISEMYSSFICGDAYTVKISTGVKNGRKLCLVKDSYGDALPPFFTGSFEEIYVVDMRYFQLNLVDFVEEHGITDLLFSCCSYSAVGPNSDNLDSMRTSGGSAHVQEDEPEEESEAAVSSEEPKENEPESEDNTPSVSYDEQEYDEVFDNIDVDDGQFGIVGNINDNTGGDDDVGYDDYDEDY